MGRTKFRAAAAAAATVIALDLVALAIPVAAAEFDGVGTLDEFVSALEDANTNGEADTITVSVDAEQIWSYPGTLAIGEDLTIQLAPDSATVTFTSSDASAVTVAAGVRLTARGVGFRGVGGHGIDASDGADITLTDVRLSQSSGNGLTQVGGTLNLTGVRAAGNAVGIQVSDVDSAQFSGVDASANRGTGLALVIPGGEVLIQDSNFDGNGNSGVRLTASDAATITIQGSSISYTAPTTAPGCGSATSSARAPR